MLLLLSTLLLAAPAPVSKVYDQPVAVMPFKNLNDDVSLDWLKVGIAETMVSDLRKTGKVKVVERDQVDRAMGEIALTGAAPGTTGGVEESTAARVGKLVGARTVVLGSYQRADKQVRINARFVSVETGVVLDTAKTTGPIEKIFSLQDEVVDRLLGGGPKAPAPVSRPKRKETPKAVEAYKLYAMSLVTASDADKVGYLKRSLEQDPDFSYALDDLAALEKRLGEYRKARETAMPGQDGAGWTRLADATLKPLERAQAANALLQTRIDDRRYRALLADAERVLSMEIPDPPPGAGVASAHDFALWALFEAQMNLRRPEEAVKTGEQYLKRFPTGVKYKDVEEGILDLKEERTAKNANRSFFTERFEKIEKTRAEERAKLTGKDLEDRMRGLDYYRCEVMWQHRAVWYERMVEECAAFIAKYEKDPAEHTRYQVRAAKRNEIEALAGMGDFVKAVPKAQALMKEPAVDNDPFGREMKELLELEWPRDAQ